MLLPDPDTMSGFMSGFTPLLAMLLPDPDTMSGFMSGYLSPRQTLLGHV